MPSCQPLRWRRALTALKAQESMPATPEGARLAADLPTSLERQNRVGNVLKIGPNLRGWISAHLGAGWCAVRPKSPPTMQSAHPQRQHPRETRLQVFQAHFVLLRVRDDRDQVRQQRLEIRSAAAARLGFTPPRRQSVPAAYGDAVRSGTARAVSRHCGATAQEARARRAHRHRRRGGRTDGGIASGPVPRSARMLAAGSRATTD